MLAVSMPPPSTHFSPVHTHAHTAKRPKLSLQTSALPISYGSSSKGLSTIAIPTATVTPTTINTFNNTYDLSYRPSPVSTIDPTKTVRISRSQSPRPKRSERAYNPLSNLPYGIKPILKNSALRQNAVTASPLTSTRKVFFPQPKKVSFKTILEEVIVNKIYTATHLDLLEEDRKDEAAIESIEREEQPEETEVTLTSSPTKKRKSSSKDSVSLSHVEIKPCSAVPSQTHSKKRRRWEWTLSPVASASLVEDLNNSPKDELEHESINSGWVVISTKRADLDDTDRPCKRPASASDTDIPRPVWNLRKAPTW